MWHSSSIFAIFIQRSPNSVRRRDCSLQRHSTRSRFILEIMLQSCLKFVADCDVFELPNVLGEGPPIFRSYFINSGHHRTCIRIWRRSTERAWRLGAEKKEIKKSMTQQNSIDLCHGAGDARLWLISTVLFVAMVHAATGHSQAPTYSIWFTGICLFYSVSLSPKQCEITPCL